MAAKGAARAPGAGRKAGVPNKATAEIKLVAQAYGAAAVKRLAKFAGLVDGEAAAQSEQAQVAACKELLDRAYGKSSQPLSSDPDNPVFPSEIKVRIVRPGA